MAAWAPGVDFGGDYETAMRDEQEAPGRPRLWASVAAYQICIEAQCAGTHRKSRTTLEEYLVLT